MPMTGEEAKTVLVTDDSNVHYIVPYPMERRHLANFVACCAGKVDILSLDCVVNGVCWYGSGVGPRIADGLPSYPAYSLKRIASNIKHLVDSGADPPRVVAEECHKHGMKMLADFRMGLTTKSGSGAREHGVYYNAVCEQWHDKTIYNLEFAPYAPASRIDTRGATLDYSHPEVQELILRPMRELAENYPIDGVELNYIRGGAHFESHEAERKVPLMTEFVRKARDILTAGARRQGKEHLMLAVRIFHDIAWCRKLGLDVASWIKEGLIDLVMPDQVHCMDFDARIDDLVGLCEGTACRVLPSVHITERPPESFDRIRGGADNWYRQGAHGVSAFNFYFYISGRGADLRFFDELRNPQAVAAGRKVYRSMQRKGTVDDIYHISAARVCFERHEIGVRKTVAAPRILCVENGTVGQGKLRLQFQADEWSWDDELDVDVDGTVLGAMECWNRVDPRMQETVMSDAAALDVAAAEPPGGEGDWENVWRYRFRASIPPGTRMHEIGFRLRKRPDLASAMTIHSIEVVVEQQQGKTGKEN